MEFWSIEVKSGESFKVKANEDRILHLSQASLNEVKKTKPNESVYVYVTVDGKKFVLGTLSPENLPQVQFDLVFDRDFEISHSLKGGTVSFLGYKRVYDGTDDEDDDSDEDIPLSLDNNTGKPEIKATEEKPADAQKAQVDEDSSDDSDDSSDDSSDDEDESDEEEPVKAEPGKKRASEKEPETPASKKKVKLTTPEKTDGKKGSGVHVDTPHPSKKAGKTSAAATSDQKTAKSGGGGSSACKSCSRTFGSESALESHTKAKHGSGK